MTKERPEILFVWNTNMTDFRPFSARIRKSILDCGKMHDNFTDILKLETRDFEGQTQHIISFI